MKKFLVAIFFLAFCGFKLTEKQAKILDRIKKAPATVTFEVIRFHQELIDGGPLKLVLSPKLTLELTNYYYIRINGDDSSVKLDWKSEDGTQKVSLAVFDKSAVGLMCADENVYYVESLGGGLQVLMKLDPVKIPKGRAMTEQQAFFEIFDPDLIGKVKAIVDAIDPEKIRQIMDGIRVEDGKVIVDLKLVLSLKGT